jgi:hypothetical protein
MPGGGYVTHVYNPLELDWDELVKPSAGIDPTVSHSGNTLSVDFTPTSTTQWLSIDACFVFTVTTSTYNAAGNLTDTVTAEVNHRYAPGLSIDTKL